LLALFSPGNLYSYIDGQTFYLVLFALLTCQQQQLLDSKTIVGIVASNEASSVPV